MVRRTGGSRKKTRHKYRKKIRERGKLSVRKFFQRFETGDKVVLKAESAVQKAMYFHRFHGKIGTVKAKAGKSYEVEIRDGGKYKTVVVHPVHLSKAQ